VCLALKIVKCRAEATAECAKLAPSGLLTVRVFAASQLEKAIDAARVHAL
jgi:hypothetical protein